MFSVSSSDRRGATPSRAHLLPPGRMRMSTWAQPQKPMSVHQHAGRHRSMEVMPVPAHGNFQYLCCCCCCSSECVITRNSTRSRHSHTLTEREESIPSPSLDDGCFDAFDFECRNRFGEQTSFSHLETLKKVCTEESRKVDYLKECVRLGMNNKRRSTKSKNIKGKIQDLFTDQSSAFWKPPQKATTPFEALDGFKREAPSYWLSSTYSYKSESQRLEMTIRQTGVLPNLAVTNELSQLTLEITVSVPRRRKQTKRVVLKQQGKDNSFKSSTVDFFIPPERSIESTSVTYRIYAKQRFCPRKVAEWKVSLKDCTSSEIYTQFNKVSFLK